jgi:hypothetical protein
MINPSYLQEVSIKTQKELSMVVHTCNPCIPEAKARELWVWGQHGLYSKTLKQNKKKKKRKEKKRTKVGGQGHNKIQGSDELPYRYTHGDT